MPNFDIGAQSVAPGQGLLMGLDPSYQARQQQVQQNQIGLDAAKAFSGGVPIDPKTGQPDYSAMATTFLQKGDVANASKLYDIGIQQGFIQQASQPSSVLGGGGPSGGQAGAAPVGGPSGGAPSPVAAVGGGSDALAPFRNAIAAVESKGAGDYAATGQTQKNGDFAIGRYQVMASNVPTWTKEVLGQAMRPDEFAANPQAQDAVFNAKFGQYLRMTGSPQDAASMWFTGAPLQRGANRADSLGTTGSGYVGKFMAALGGQRPGGMAQAGSAPANAGGAAPLPMLAQAGAASSSVGRQPPQAQVAAAPAASSGAIGPNDPVPDSMYQTALRVVGHFQNADPRNMTSDQQNTMTRAGELVSRYQAQQNTPAGGAPVQVAQNGASDAPQLSGQHPFAPTSQPAASPPVAPANVSGAAAQPAQAPAQSPAVAATGAPGLLDPSLGGLVTPAQLQQYGSAGNVARAAFAEAAQKGNNPYLKAQVAQLNEYGKGIMSALEKANVPTVEQKNARDAPAIQYEQNRETFKANAPIIAQNSPLAVQGAQDRASAAAQGKLDVDSSAQAVSAAGRRAEAAAAGTQQGQNSPGAIAAAAGRAGAVGEASKTGDYLGGLPAQYDKQAQAAQATNDNVDQMLTAAQGFRMGKGAPMEQNARKALQTAFQALGVSSPTLNSETASYEDFGKVAGVLSRNVAGSLSGPTGVQELNLLNSTLPSAEMSYDGLRGVASSLKGSADYQVAKQQAAAQWKAQNGTLNGFEADFSKNVSPSALWLHRLQVDQPDLFSHAVQQLQQTPQGKALIAKAATGLQYLTIHGGGS